LRSRDHTDPNLLLVLVIGVVRQACRNVIDVWRGVVLEIIDGVDATARALLDRTARLVILLSALLVAQSSRGSRGTEVRAAITAAGSRWSSGTAWSEAAATTATGTRAAESATAAATEAPPAWARTTESARTRTEASRPWWTRRAIFASTRFADGQRAALERLCVELADDFFRFLSVGKLDERKSTRTTGLAIDRHSDVGRLCDGCKVGPEICLARTVGEVPDEQTDCQGLLVKSLLLGAGLDSILNTL
jgi:hypothetical protein